MNVQVKVFLGWLAERLPERYAQTVADLETMRQGLRPTSVEEGVAGRDAAWRLYRLAWDFGSWVAAESFYEVYEQVCRMLAYALEGTW